MPDEPGPSNQSSSRDTDRDAGALEPSPVSDNDSVANGLNGSHGLTHQGWLAGIVGRIKGASQQSARDILETALDEDKESAGESSFTDQERTMIMRTLRFGALRVDDVMVPRADVIAIDESASLAELYRLFVEAGHSRLPVFRETFDDSLGMVHVKDLLKYIAERSGTKNSDTAQIDVMVDLSKVDLSVSLADAKLRRDVLFVPPSMPVTNLLLRMQTTHVHLAIVVDEYGGSDGIVSIEDLVEEIVGEIEDEHDAENGSDIEGSLATGLVASARASVRDLEQQLGLELLDGEEEDIDTLGGLVFTLADRVPQRGELIPHEAGVEFEVLDADPRRIKSLRIHVSDARGRSQSAETGKPDDDDDEDGRTGPRISVP